MPFPKPSIEPPVAEKRPTHRMVHGTDLHDEYAWLRADNWQEVMRAPHTLADDIRAHLEAENAYADAALASLSELKETLKTEMRGRIKEDDAAVPSPDGPYAYGMRYREGGQHQVFTREAREGGDETILLDGDELAAGKAYFRFGGVSHSDDHRYLAWSYDDNGSEKYTIRIRDLAAGVDLTERLEETSGAAGVWSADGLSLFYTRLDDNHRPSRVFRHELGTDPSEDVLIYEEADPGFFVGVGKTQSRRFLVIDCHDHQTSECWLLDLHAPGGDLWCVAPRHVGHEYSLEHRDDALIVLTNFGGAEDFKIARAPLEPSEPSSWTDIEPHQPGRLILGVAVFQRWMVCLERVDGQPRLRVHSDDPAIESWRTIAFDEEAYSLGLGSNLEFDTDTFRIGYSSPTTPQRTLDVDLGTFAQTVRKTQEIPSGHDASAYTVRRIMAPALDGETVPVTVLTRADHKDDGSAPCLLYGYGSYGISIPASFSTNALSLVDRGMVYAIAHIRGGKDKGFGWYKAGKAEHKQNTFSDFIAVRDALVERGIAAADRVVAQGGSAGGMLMGAVANQAPDKFAGIIAQVPFVDVLNTMLDASLPLTPPEWPEWGNPIEDKEAFFRIKGYSPYDAVAAQAYPAVFALAGLTDPRVTYWEPAKWVARLRDVGTGNQPVLLKTNMDAGHGGAAGRFDRLDEIAEVYAFALSAAETA